MNIYRFAGPYKWSTPFTKSFGSDDAAFQYASDMVDGPEMVSVEKYCLGGDWFGWDYTKEQWVYIPEGHQRPVCPHVRIDGSIDWKSCQQPTVWYYSDMDKRLEQIEQDGADTANSIVESWQQGKLTDEEADVLLTENENQTRQRIRVACGLTPVISY